MNQTLLFGKKLKSILNTQPFTNTCTCKTPHVILVNEWAVTYVNNIYVCYRNGFILSWIAPRHVGHWFRDLEHTSHKLKWLHGRSKIAERRSKQTTQVSLSFWVSFPAFWVDEGFWPLFSGCRWLVLAGYCWLVLLGGYGGLVELLGGYCGWYPPPGGGI